MALQSEPRLGDPIGVAPNRGPIVGATHQVPLQIVETQHNVLQPPRPIRRFERHESSAVADDASLEPMSIGQRVDFHAAVIGFAPRGFCRGAGGRYRISRQRDHRQNDHQQQSQSAHPALLQPCPSNPAETLIANPSTDTLNTNAMTLWMVTVLRISVCAVHTSEV